MDVTFIDVKLKNGKISIRNWLLRGHSFITGRDI